MQTDIIVRPATETDIPDIVSVEQRVYADLGTPVYGRAHVQGWMQTFESGVCIAEHNGIVVGYGCAQRTFVDPLNFPDAEYDEVTDSGRLVGTHYDAGTSLQFFSLASLRRGAGSVITQYMYDLCLKLRVDWYYLCPHPSRFSAYWEELPQEYKKEHIEMQVALWYLIEYTRQKEGYVFPECPSPSSLALPSPCLSDPVLNCHLREKKIGLVGLLPNFMIDPRSRNWAALYAWKVQ